MNEIGEISCGSIWFQWKLKNFCRKLQKSTLDYINSPTFRYDRNYWYMALGVKDKHDPNPLKNVSLYLCRRRENYPECVDVSLGFCTYDGKKLEVCKKTANFQEGNFFWGPVTSIFDLDAILGPTDNIIVFCSLKKDLVEEEESESEESSDEEELKAIKAECCASLSKDMKKLFYDEIGCDVSLIVSSRRFSAHSSVLSSRSPVFYGMLKDHPESLELEECEPDVFTIFLEFLYLGRIEDPSMTNALKLYRQAHQYEVPLLKEQCLDVMYRNLSLDTVCDVLRFAKEYCLIELLEQATEFLMNNHLEVLDSKEWIQFLQEDPLLTNEFMQHIVSFVNKKLIKKD